MIITILIKITLITIITIIRAIRWRVTLPYPYTGAQQTTKFSDIAYFVL